jgi:hypothetical protein
MAIQFVNGQVQQSDPNPGGPYATSNIKYSLVKVARLTSANFGTSAVNTLLAVLPADSTIISLEYWQATQLAGGGITAATLSLGTASAGTQFVNASTLAFSTAGIYSNFSPANNIMQKYSLPLGADIQIWGSGIATTGAPTSGEAFVIIKYVR